MIWGNAGRDVLIGGAGDGTVDGSEEDDLIFGDNVELARRVTFLDASFLGDSVTVEISNPRFQTLSGTLLYSRADQAPSPAGNASGALLSDGTPRNYRDPDSAPHWAQFEIENLFHSEDIEAGEELAESFGDDYIAGGAGHDMIFGQLGADVIQGDGAIDGKLFGDDPETTYYDGRVAAFRTPGGAQDPIGALTVLPSFEAMSDGDDYVEGGGGSDAIFGGLGQDDLVGGSSSFFSLGDPVDTTVGAELRPDVSDYILGGAGTRIDRHEFVGSNFGTVDDDSIALSERHPRDADTIVGDNGNIVRIVGVNGLDVNPNPVNDPLGPHYPSFNYDDPAFGYDGDLKIVVRGVTLLDYTPGGPDFRPDRFSLAETPGFRNQFDLWALVDIGGHDEIHAESGDDTVYSGGGNDRIFGDSDDDDLVGGWGNDWLSGGTGQDGVLGDDGRIFTSRNSSTVGEPLFGVQPLAQVNQLITTPGGVQRATINVAGELKKSVDLTPFNPVQGGDELSDPAFADDILYGGLNNDWLHGGAGDDAVSGAEALEPYYDRPFNPGNVLRYSDTTGTFAEYDEFEPRLEILYGARDGQDVAFNLPAGKRYILQAGAPFILNFDHTEGENDGWSSGTAYAPLPTDGDDKIFGDLGNDWLVGGTGRDDLYGGWGDDLLNADDDQHTTPANDTPDTHPSYEDRAYGGAGRDVLIGNTGGDRLIDWVGEFNSYLVPFAPFGLGTVSRTLQPQLAEFLYALSASDGADPTRTADVGPSADPARNGEPYGELGVVRQQDFAWQDQTGGPRDPQAGNIPGGKRDVLRSASFDDGSNSAFFADSGVWQSANGVLQVQGASLGSDAASVFHIGDALPVYFEVQASVMAVKPTAGWKANSYVIFDYQGKQDFKFAGIDVALNKLVMGHRDASGWHVDEQAPVPGGVKSDKYYNLLLAVNGVNAILVMDNKNVFTHTYQPRVVDGYSYGLNWGMVGVGSDNSRGAFDNIQVQILPPQLTLDTTENFSDGVANLFTGFRSGAWSVGGGVYTATPNGATGINLLDLGPDHLAVSSYLELSAKVSAAGRAGFIFDRYDAGSFKFVAIDAPADQVIIGHYTPKGGWVSDAVVSKVINPSTAYMLGASLKGSTVSVTLDGQTLLGFAFNAGTVDGGFGLLATGGAANFDDVRVKTNDPAFVSGPALVAAASATGAGATPLSETALTTIAEAAKQRWSATLGADAARLADVRFAVADLSGAILGQTLGDTILVDHDAAGHGWFVDATPLDDSEFWRRHGVLLARMQSAAQDRIDLLSAVMHELGHVLGREHQDSGVMADVLRPGVRTVAAQASPTLAPASEPNAYALQRLAAAIPPAAPAAQTLGPVIDWSARATGLQLPALPKVERAAPAWATDFVGDLGRSESERNPNEKLRLKVPIVSNVAAKLSALKKDVSR